MNLLGINEVREGMVLAKDIINDLGIIYMASGTVLSNSNIEGLKKMEVDFVYVKDVFEMEEFLNSKSITVEEAYNKLIIMYKSIYMNVRLGRVLDVKNIRDKALPLISRISSENNIMENLMKIKVSESYLYKHAVDVSILSKLIAKWLNLTEKIQDEIAVCAFLHDIGKTKISVDILNKPGELTYNEYETIKRHSEFGYEIVSSAKNISEKIADGILYHHERFDGSGYPNGLSKEQIPLYSRIIGVADMFDAITSNKSYKNKISVYMGAKILKEESFNKFDPRITETFIYNLSKFYVGNKVKLSNGEIGEVILLNKSDVNRPLVKTDKEYIDLATNYKLEIIEVLY